MRLKDRFRSLRRRAMAPFKRLEKKIKLSAQRMVVRAIQESGAMKVEQRADTQPHFVESVPVVVAPVVAAPANDSGATKLLLALLKASQCSVKSEVPSFEACAIGDGRLLVSHPSSGFMIADASNLKLLPQLILKSYQEQATIAIEREFCDGDSVIHLGAGQGYHTLTLAHTVGDQGRVIVVESQASERSVLRMNIEAHSLESQVSLRDISADQRFPYEQFIGYPAISGIYVSSDREIPSAWLSGLTEFFHKVPNAVLVVGTRRQTVAQYVAQRGPSELSARRAA